MATKERTLEYPLPRRYGAPEKELYRSRAVEWPEILQAQEQLFIPYHERTVEQVRRALVAARECIEASPRKLGGIPVLRGTRFSVAQLFAELAEADNVEDIAEEFDLDASQISTLLHALSKYLDRSWFR